ncbi:MAG: serine/threonine protein kinase [Candidatus Latescibacterota bacterium]|jgi:serine/threonine-protein kinase
MQDSGNISYGARLGGTTYFVKSAGHPNSVQSYFAHAGRTDLLRNAVHLRQSVEHETLPALYTIESPHGPLLVYEWVAGDLLRVENKDRNDPAQPYARFRHLPTAQITSALDRGYEAHAILAASGWVAVDFYDGSLIYDFARQRIQLIDLDHYHRGPFTNEMGRMFGSTRFMAPEEFERGARIDERTTLFSLARTAALFLSDGTLNCTPFRARDSLYQVMHRACEPDTNQRFASVANFFSAWRQALNAN